MGVPRHLQSADDPTDSGDTAWLLTSTCLVCLMVPALALFYGGLVGQRAVVNTMLLSFISFVTITLVWSLIGYSLAFGPNPAGVDSVADGWIGGDLYGAYDSPDKVRVGTLVPEHAYFVFQLMFAIITAAVMSGSVVGRITLWAWSLFSAVWCMLVYVPLARWIFYSGGWLFKWGVLDFAGGLVVETSSGVSAFVLAYWLGPGAAPHAPAHNLPFVLLGVGLLWVGWFGFNGGSAISSGYLSARALTNTHLAACSAMAVWAILEAALPKISGLVYEYNRPRPRAGAGAVNTDNDSVTSDGASTPNPGAAGAAPQRRRPVVPWGNPSGVGVASGCLVGLVAITPGAGMVSQMYALLIGAITAPICFFAARFLKRVRVDDRLECLPIHGVAGAVGTLLTGIFASKNEMSASDGAAYGNPGQFGKQLAAVLVTIAVCVVGTSLSFFITRLIGDFLGLPVRVSAEHEMDIDKSVHGEHGYEHLSVSHHQSVAGGHHQPVAAFASAAGAGCIKCRSESSSDQLGSLMVPLAAGASSPTAA